VTEVKAGTVAVELAGRTDDLLDGFAESIKVIRKAAQQISRHANKIGTALEGVAKAARKASTDAKNQAKATENNLAAPMEGAATRIERAARRIRDAQALARGGRAPKVSASAAAPAPNATGGQRGGNGTKQWRTLADAGNAVNRAYRKVPEILDRVRDAVQRAGIAAGTAAPAMRRMAVAIGQAAQASAGLRQLGTATAAAGAGAARIGAGMRRVGVDAESAGRDLATGLSLPLMLMGGFALKSAVDIERGLAQVAKTTNATAPQVAVLEERFTALSESLAVEGGVKGLASIAAVGGQLGVSNNALADFTETVSKLDMAVESLTAEEAATGLAQFANVAGTAQGKFSNLASSLAYLGDNGASSEKQILEMGLRIVGAGRLINMSEGQIFGFANALASVGIEAEMGGTAISRVMRDVSVAVANGGAELNNFAAVAGVSSAQFKVAFEQDAANAVVMFIEGLGRMKREGKNVFSALERLGFAEARVSSTLLRASQASDMMRASMEQGAQAFTDNTKLAQEAGRANQTHYASLVRLGNTATNVAKDFGKLLFPAVRATVNGLSGAGETLRSLAAGFAASPRHMRVFAGGLLAIAAGIGPAIIGVTTLTRAIGALRMMAMTAVTGIAGLGRAIAALSAARQAVGTVYALQLALRGLSGLLIGGGIVVALGLIAGAFVRAGQKARQAAEAARVAADDFAAALTTMDEATLGAKFGDKVELVNNLADSLKEAESNLASLQARARAGERTHFESSGNLAGGASGTNKTPLGREIETTQREVARLRAAREAARQEMDKVGDELAGRREAARQARDAAARDELGSADVSDLVDTGGRERGEGRTPAKVMEDARDAVAEMNREFAAMRGRVDAGLLSPAQAAEDRADALLATVKKVGELFAELGQMQGLSGEALRTFVARQSQPFDLGGGTTLSALTSQAQAEAGPKVRAVAEAFAAYEREVSGALATQEMFAAATRATATPVGALGAELDAARTRAEGLETLIKALQAAGIGLDETMAGQGKTLRQLLGEFGAQSREVKTLEGRIERLNQVMQDGKDIAERWRTPAEEMAAQLQRLNDLFAAGAINAGVFAQEAAKIREEFKRQAGDIGRVLKDAFREAGADAARSLAQSIVATLRGKKMDLRARLRDIFWSAIENALTDAVNARVAGALGGKGLGGLLKGVLGSVGLGSLLGSLAGSGGPPGAGAPVAGFSRSPMPGGGAGAMAQAGGILGTLNGILGVLRSRSPLGGGGLLGGIFGRLFGGGRNGRMGGMPFSSGIRFGGFAANGRNASGGSAYVVGERGRELFVPGQRGQIRPMESPSTRSVAGAAVRPIAVDFSSLPRPMTPREAARDQAWQQLMRETLLAAKDMGYVG
jgi:TP901 family phage tail tape measure protein